MPGIKPIWTDNYTVNWYDADINNQASLVTLCNFLQESAWRHANHLGFGYRTTAEINQVWVIIRLLVKMERFPSWGETVTVRTWPKGMDGLVALRDFEILDSRENRIGAATTQWFILDAKTRKPQPALIVRDIIPLVTSKPALDDVPGKIRIPDDIPRIATRQVQFSDLDMYRHVNNARYTEWTMNLFPEMLTGSFRIHSYLIEFLAESHLDDTIDLYGITEKDTSRVQALRKTDGKIIFRAKIGWKTAG